MGIHAVHIQFRRMLKRLLNGFLGNFVEYHATVFFFVVANNLAQVPGNGFSFAVQVRCQINVVGIFSQPLQLFYHFLFAGKDLIVSFPGVIGVDTHAADQLFASLALFIDRFLIGRHFTGLRSLTGTFFGIAGLGRTRNRQITDMANAGFNDKVVSQVFIDGFRLGRRLHDNQRFAHSPLLYLVLLMVQALKGDTL